MTNFKKDKTTSWCPGCGNFPLLDAYTEALSELGLEKEETVVVSGIGQAAKIPHYINSNGFQGLHGRALPVAFGIKAANPALTVIVNTGDGDGYGEGGNHFIHAIRRNINITHLVHDNQIYGLTKGQGSPTTSLGQATSMQMHGVTSRPFNPMLTALSVGCTFVARAYVGDKEKLKEIIKEAVKHKGYSLIDIFQPCVTFNKVNTYEYYKNNTYYLDETYDNSDFEKALLLTAKDDAKIPLGIIYQKKTDDYLALNPHIEKGLLMDNYDINKIKNILSKKLSY